MVIIVFGKGAFKKSFRVTIAMCYVGITFAHIPTDGYIVIMFVIEVDLNVVYLRNLISHRESFFTNSQLP